MGWPGRHRLAAGYCSTPCRHYWRSHLAWPHWPAMVRPRRRPSRLCAGARHASSAARTLPKAGLSPVSISCRNCTESDRHPNTAFDLPGRACSATPLRRLAALVKALPAVEKARSGWFQPSPARRMACSKRHDSITRSCPTPTTSRADRAPDSEQNTRGPIRGSAELDGRSSAWNAVLPHRAGGIFSAQTGTFGLRCGAGARRPRPHRHPGKMQPGDCVMCNRNHASAAS